MKSLDDVRKTVDQLANLAEHESIKVFEMQEDDDFGRLGIMKVLKVIPPLCQFHVSHELYKQGPIEQKECLIKLLAEALYLKREPLQCAEFRSQRKKTTNITDSTFDELKEEVRLKVNRQSGSGT